MRRRHDRRRRAERIERPHRRHPRPALCQGRSIRSRAAMVWRRRSGARHLRDPARNVFRGDRLSCPDGMPAHRLCRDLEGAEASLLAAAHDPRIDVVVAISPTSVVWGNIGPGRDGVSWPERSSWTLEGIPLPFVPSNPAWNAEYVDGLVSYRGLFQRALQTFKDAAAEAAIPAEAISADIVLVAGGDDALWPSLDFAHGGNDDADTRLGRLAWEHIRGLL